MTRDRVVDLAEDSWRAVPMLVVGPGARQIETHYQLEVFRNGSWLANERRFPTYEAAEEFRDKLISDTGCWGYHLIVEMSCPTRIVRMVEEQSVTFAGLPKKEKA